MMSGAKSIGQLNIQEPINGALSNYFVMAKQD